MNKKFAIKACCCISERLRVRPNQGGSRKRAGRSQQGVELQKQRKDSEGLEITQMD
jgi:hypothetical protein